MLLNFIKKNRILLLHILALLIIIAVFITVRSVKIANDRRGPEKAFNIAGNIVRVEYQLPGEEEITAVTERKEDIKVLLKCIKLSRKNFRANDSNFPYEDAGPIITFTYADGRIKRYGYFYWLNGKYPDPLRAFEEIPYIAEQLSAPAE